VYEQCSWCDEHHTGGPENCQPAPGGLPATQEQEQGNKRMSMSNVFQGFDKVTPGAGSGSGNYLPGGGKFIVEVVSIKFKPSDKTAKQFYIVEFTVLESDNDKVGAGDGKLWGWAHDVTNRYYGASHVKQFLAAAVGLDPYSPEAMAIDATAADESYGESQPMVGVQLRVSTKNKTTNNGNNFTIYDWAPLGE
jgi:hypothetical protein